MKHNTIITLIKKDLKRVFTDRSLFFSTFVVPTLLIIAMFMAMTMIISMVQNRTSINKLTIGIVNCPDEVELLIDGDIISFEKIENEMSVDPSHLLDENEYYAVLVFDSDFEQKIDDYEKSSIPAVTLYYDQNKSESLEVVNYLSTNVFDKYEDQIRSSRIIDTRKLSTFSVNYCETGSKGKPIDSFAGMIIPLMLLFLLTHAAVSLGVDLITTEKEKNTMLGYLLMPISRIDIAIAKCVTLIMITVIDAIIMMSAIMLAIPAIIKLTLGEALATTLSLGLGQAIALIVVLLSTTILVSSIVCLISGFCKSTKIASGVSVLLYVTAIASGFIAMFSDILSLSPAMNILPYLGNAVVIQKIITATYNIGDIAVVAVSNLLIAFALIFITSKAFTKEKYMINI